MTIERVLMCPPDYFDIEYSINPWMDVTNKVDRDVAFTEWHNARRTLEELGVEIDVIEPEPGLPDMTFAGDCGMVVGRRFLVSRFRHAERAPEAGHYRRWFDAHGYEIIDPPDGVIFEGLGDVVYFDRHVVLGNGPRSSPDAARLVVDTFPELEVRAEVDLCGEDFFHTGLAAALLDEDTILYYPGAFTPESCAQLEAAFDRTVAVSEDDARIHFVANNIVIGRHLLIDGCSASLRDQLGELGFEVVVCPMDEFKKSGGSVRCLIVAI